MNEHDLGYATRFNVEHAENEMVVAIEGQRVSFKWAPDGLNTPSIKDGPFMTVWAIK